MIGRGSYGCVTKAKCKTTGRIVAIKIFHNHSDREYDTVKLVREIMIIKKLNQYQRELGLNEENGFIPTLYDVIKPRLIYPSTSIKLHQMDQFAIVTECLDTDLEHMYTQKSTFN